jgi:hypothetical protein
MTTLRAQFDGKVLVPTEPVDLPKDRVLEIDVREIDELPKGSPELIRRIMRELPHVPPEDVDEMERQIEAGKMPVQYKGEFDTD